MPLKLPKLPKTAKFSMSSVKGIANKGPSNKVKNIAAGVTGKVTNFACGLSKKVVSAPGIQQLAVGTTAGFCTGYLTSRVGRIGAFSVGSSIILISAANQAGLVNVNWDKFFKKGESLDAGEQLKKIQEKFPKMTLDGLKLTKGNKMLAVGFLGGFLVGLAF